MHLRCILQQVQLPNAFFENALFFFFFCFFKLASQGKHELRLSLAMPNHV